MPPALGGYDHNIEFYGNNLRTNIVIAGNYIGVGIDGVTRFTNGVPVLSASGDGAEFRFGSDLDGVSDTLEGNVVADRAGQLWNLLRVNGKPKVHTFRLHWLLPDWDWELEEEGGGYGLRLKSPLGWIKLQLSCDQPGAEICIVRAGELLKGIAPLSEISGWFSPTYGQKEAALSCSLQAGSQHDCKFSSHFIFPDH